jgi:ATP-binding cassette subfamily F protein uup
MSALVACKDLTHTHLEQPLFQGLSLTVERGERVGVIGANGSGKSTLLKILAGELIADRGERTVSKELRVAHVTQEVSFPPDLTVERVLYLHLKESIDSAGRIDPDLLDEADRHARVGMVLSVAGFDDPDELVSTLSGGWLKRLAVGCALLRRPDLLLLDEPTNHLDLEGIEWLERLLSSGSFGAVVVTHDRAFLEKIAQRILEIDQRHPGGFLSVDGTYSDFLEKRAQVETAASRKQQALASKVRREVEWLRQGPKARTSKAKGRLDEAAKLKEQLEVMRRRRVAGKTRIDFASTGRKTRRLMVAEGVSKSLGGKSLFDDLDLVLEPDMKLGLVGSNGSGKTTLLKVLAGELQPDRGEVRWANDLRVVYFDQGREQLDPSQTLRQALAGRNDRVVYRGKPIHVKAWAHRFRFSTSQLELPVARLSGGEQAKLLIARLMLRPADVLLLDEPTNDLDIPTLEVLEESLSGFPGGVVMVTHDRYFLDSVCTLMVGLANGGGSEIFADCSQWRARLRARTDRDRRKETGSPKKRRAKVRKPLTYMEEKEYGSMEGRILDAEARLEELKSELEDPAVATDAETLSSRYQKFSEAEKDVAELYERWSELEEKLLAGPRIVEDR